MTLALSGWNPTGIGSPNGVLTQYLIAPLLAVLGLAFGSYGAFLIFLGGIALLAWCAARLAVPENEIVRASIFAWLLFNPWTYTELVAGHPFMVLSFVATACLACILARKIPDAAAAAIAAVALIVAQLQYYLIAAPLAVLMLAWRKMYAAALAVLLLGLPVFAAAKYAAPTLAATPFSIDWERSQAMSLAAAATLRGYFTGYASAFYTLAADIALWSWIALAVAGILAGRVRWKTLVALACILLPVVFATGPSGAGGFIFSALERVPALGIFREVYDLLGFTALGYAYFVVSACRRFKALVPVAPLCAALLIGIWMAFPPSEFWVDARTLPTIALPAGISNQRIALQPFYQGLIYHSRAAGADPDALPRPNNVIAINQYLPLYPINSAMSDFALSGDATMLGALSVTHVIDRPGYESDLATLRLQIPNAPSVTLPNRPGMSIGGALPEMAVYPGSPSIVSKTDDLSADDVFFGDAAPLCPVSSGASCASFPHALRIAVPRRSVDPRTGWIDARLMFWMKPELGQPFGGVYTTSAQPYVVHHEAAVLVWSSGRIIDDLGRLFAHATRGYQWLPVRGEHSLRCEATCVFAVGADARIPEFAPPRRTRPVGLEFNAIFPWLVSTQLHAGQGGVLRYNTAYDEHWRAYANGSRLVHVKLDGVFNGWLLPENVRARSLYLVYAPAVLQRLCELLGYFAFAAAVVVLVDGARKRAERTSSAGR